MLAESIREGSVPVEFELLHFNTSGVIDGVERLRLLSDDEALARARDVRSRSRVEVWRGSRRVGVIPPVSAAGAA